MTIVKAAAVQLSPVLYSREGTVERVVAKIDELATLGVHYAVFPETLVPYYPYFSYLQRPYDMAPSRCDCWIKPSRSRRRQQMPSATPRDAPAWWSRSE